MREFFVRYDCKYRRRTGGSSRNFQEVDGGKGTVSDVAELCGIALSEKVWIFAPKNGILAANCGYSIPITPETGGKGVGKTMLDRTSLVITILGAINWLLVGLFQFDLVAYICGGQAAVVSRVIYTLVGLAGVWCITMLFRETEPIEGDAHA